MASWNFIFLCCGLFVIEIKSVRGVSDKERSALFSSLMPHVLECSGEFEIGTDIAKLLENPTNLDDVNPCLVGCVMKKMKLMNSKGLYDAEKGKKISKKYFKSDDDLKNLDKLGDTCLLVNEKVVSDGEKGCERAKLLLDCFMPHKDLFMPSALKV